RHDADLRAADRASGDCRQGGGCRGIAYKPQERLLGGLSKSILRKLEGVNVESEARSVHKPPAISLKAGTRLILEVSPMEVCPRSRGAGPGEEAVPVFL